MCEHTFKMIIKNKIIPFGNYKAMNLFGIIFTKSSLSEIELNHEKIHTKQMLELLIIGFYLWYIIEYLLIRICRVKDSQSNCYHEISFEEEAHNNDTNLNYLKNRKPFAWIKYIKINSND